MLEVRHWLETLSSLTLGGAIGAMFGVVVYFYFGVHFGGISSYSVIGLCGAVGSGVQRFLQPVTGALGLMVQLILLKVLRNLGVISHTTYQRIVNRLVERRFLGKK